MDSGAIGATVPVTGNDGNVRTWFEARYDPVNFTMVMA